MPRSYFGVRWKYEVTKALMDVDRVSQVFNINPSEPSLDQNFTAAASDKMIKSRAKGRALLTTRKKQVHAE